MIIPLVVLLLAAILFAAGFALHFLWWVAAGLLVVWIFALGFPRADEVGARKSWFRW
ncbi:hypothetical protein ACFV4K_08465 [Nocardia sp. NPDC059764]|uniref:hypothetical protein n=1 Tax=Nocardia sp. NPDC059764 TaxID=3346939 RepID=UPI003668F674